jgi:hypothetical protein
MLRFLVEAIRRFLETITVGAAHKRDKYPIQILSLAVIMVDQALQSRIRTDPAYVREYSDALLDGCVFPPVVVYFDGKVYWLADGFHRHGAHKAAAKIDKQFLGIRAEVRQGSRDDAFIYSAGTNYKVNVPRTPECRRKACEMLFSHVVWGRKTNEAIAKHVHCKMDTVRRYRMDWHNKNSTPYPDTFVDDYGKSIPARKAKPVDLPGLKLRGAPPAPSRFAPSPAKPTNGTAAPNQPVTPSSLPFVGGQSSPASRESLYSQRSLSEFFRKAGVYSEATGLGPSRYPELFGVVVGDTAVTWTHLGGDTDPVKAVGRAVLLKEACDRMKAVVLCNEPGKQKGFPDLASAFGVTFQTPEAFVAERIGPAEEN